jgi:hypothetical protein
MAREFIAKENSRRLRPACSTDTRRLADADAIVKLKVENNPKSANYLLQLAGHYAGTSRRAEMAP